MPGIKPSALVGARNRIGDLVKASPALVAEAQRRGWVITEHGRIGLGVTTGPCARCRQPCRRYGTTGNPVCSECREGTKR